MPNDTMTLALSEDVPFSAFVKAMSSFNALVQSLGTEFQVRGDVEWFVDALEKSSALATIRGESESPEKVETVVNGFTQIAKALEMNLPMPPYRAAPIAHARDVVELLNEHITITAVRFETAVEDHIVTALPSIGAVQLKPAYGAIEGRIQTLTNRKTHRFTLYDSMHDRAVSCYVAEGHEAIMRELWDKQAIVEGLVTREPNTGRPLSIRGVTTVHELDDKAGDYRDARGVVPFANGPSPEEIIRRLRDG